jgi:hypothetical protein
LWEIDEGVALSSHRRRIGDGRRRVSTDSRQHIESCRTRD